MAGCRLAVSAPIRAEIQEHGTVNRIQFFLRNSVPVWLDRFTHSSNQRLFVCIPILRNEIDLFSNYLGYLSHLPPCHLPAGSCRVTIGFLISVLNIPAVIRYCEFKTTRKKTFDSVS